MADYTDGNSISIPFYQRGSDEVPANPIFVTSSGGSVVYYRNKVFDPGGPNWILWTTTYPDSTGIEYPDPYGTGFAGCSGFRITAQYS